MDNNLLYYPTDLVLSDIIKEEVDRLIETLDIQEKDTIEPTNNNSLLDTTIIEASTITKTNNNTQLENQQLITPSPTPSLSPTPIRSPKPMDFEIVINQLQVPTSQPTTSGNQTQQGNKISRNINPENILKGTRRLAYIIVLQQLDKLVGYHALFNTAIRAGGVTKPLHQDTLPPPPKSWKQMQKHPYAKEFKKVADKEFNALLNKGTFEYIDKSKVDKQEPLPLMWVFTYKFDQDGYLIKYKARLVARGDLQYTIEDTYAATLIAQIFRAIIAIIVAFDLETRQYNVVNAFANALLPNPIACECTKGYNKPRFILRILRALYRLKISPILWYKEFTITLENLGLYLVLGTNCLFMNN